MPIGVKIGGLDGVQIGRDSKMGKLQFAADLRGEREFDILLAETRQSMLTIDLTALRGEAESFPLHVVHFHSTVHLLKLKVNS